MWERWRKAGHFLQEIAKLFDRPHTVESQNIFVDTGGITATTAMSLRDWR